MRCVFTNLLPPDGGSRDPCAVLLETTGVRDGQVEPLVLIDQPLAAASLARGERDALAPLFALSPEVFFLEEPEGAEVLAAHLRALGLPVFGPEDTEHRWRVADYGTWTAPILQNGLTLTAAPCGRLDRPGRASIAGLDLEQVGALLAAHQATLQGFLEPLPQRARGVVLEDQAADRWRLRALLQRVEQSGLFVRAVRERSPTPAAAMAAVEAVVEQRLRGRDVRLEAPGLAERPGLGGLQAQEAATTGLRWADDATRAVAFAALAASRRNGQHEAMVQQAVEDVLGPATGWVGAYHRHLHTPAARVVLLPTWQCELRCLYCAIGKTDAREMSPEVGHAALDVLLSAPTPQLELAFFGGEPLLRWELVRELCDRGTAEAEAQGRHLRVQITTNAWAMTEDILDDLARWDSHVQLSLDGDPSIQNQQRRPREAGDSYLRGPAAHLPGVHARGIDYRVIMVVTPKTAPHMAESFAHLLSLGARCIQLNYAIGIPWEAEDCAVYARGLQAIGQQIEAAWQAGRELTIINLEEPASAVRNNLHVTVDFDGTVYGGNAFLVQAARREQFALGHVDDGHAWHRYLADGKTDADIFANWKRRASLENTLRIGRVEASFVRFMQRRHAERLGAQR